MFVSDLILLYQKKDPMHPAIPLTFDLLAWTGVLAITIILSLFSIDEYGSCSYYDYSSNEYREDCSIRDFVESAERAAIAFSYMAV
jgi:hypothetical protein